MMLDLKVKSKSAEESGLTPNSTWTLARSHSSQGKENMMIKKMGVITIGMFLMFSALLAGDGAAAPLSGNAGNGITFFQDVAKADCFDAGLPKTDEAAARPWANPSNGITYFEQRPAGSGAHGNCAGHSKPDQPGRRVYNGITVF
jgi:hypothetical protein